jgi:hypothetical protein
VDTPKPRPVPRSHILIQRIHRLRPRHLPILFVHIVRATARIVADPDTEVLDLEGTLLVHHVERDDFTVGFLDLAQLHEEVPEAGFGDDIVGCEDAHAVEFGCWVGVSGEVPAYDLIFVEATWWRRWLAVALIAISRWTR